MSQGPWGRDPPRNVQSYGQTGGSASGASSRMEPTSSSLQTNVLSGFHITRPKSPGNQTQPPSSGPSQDMSQTPMPLRGIPQQQYPSATKSPAPISIPTSQWPLSGDNGSSKQMQSNSGGGPSGRSPPQRPPRPSYVPAILDNSRFRARAAAVQQPKFQQQGQDRPQPRYWEESFTSLPSHESFPVGLSDTSDTSRRTSTSSTYSSPALEYPAIFFQQPRKSPSLGPPPSSRRGASSYYSQSSYVAPIPEEVSENTLKSHGSFASSHVMPKSWGDAPTKYKTGEYDCEEEGNSTGEGEDGSDVGILMNGEPPGVVRQASLGKRHKSSLRTIQSSQVLREDRSNAGPESIKTNASADTTADFSGRTGFLSSSSSSTHSGQATATGLPEDIPPVPRLIDPRVQKILDGLEKGGTLESSEVNTPTTLSTPSVMDEKGSGRPSPLVVDRAKEVETRSSLTSLPELIKRATRLASNLDRGKTSSRLGMLDIFSSADHEKGRLPNRRNSGSIQELLASFPSPGLSTPPGERTRWPGTYTNSNLNTAHTVSPPNSLKKPRKRRCCGMPIWAFVLLCLVLVLAIAAAVIIPVTLVVLPRQHNGGPTSLAECQKSTACSNGGSSIVVGNTCHCICVNGFSGLICAVADNACTTTNIASYNNVSIGNSIPRLLSAANAIYGVPLDSSTLLTNFSSSNLSCSSANALVTFNYVSQRRSLPVQLNLIDDQPPSPLSLAAQTLEIISPSKVHIPRASVIPSPDAITSNGIVLAAPTTVNPSPSATTTESTSTSTASLSTPSSSSSSNNNAVTQQILDFARVAVLYIFQESTLDTAVTAQGRLQQALGASTYNASLMSAGNNITVDLGTFQIRLGNGTVVGSKMGTTS